MKKISEALNRPLEYFFSVTTGHPRALGTVIFRVSIGDLSARRFIELVYEKTGGELSIQIYQQQPSSDTYELVKGLVEGSIHIFIDDLSSLDRYAPLCSVVFQPYFFRDAAHSGHDSKRRGAYVRSVSHPETALSTGRRYFIGWRAANAGHQPRAHESPEVTALDEPSPGLAPLLVRVIFDTIRQLKHDGTTILLVEQNARLVLDVADRAYVMETCRITLAGPAAELKHDPQVEHTYLGT